MRPNTKRARVDGGETTASAPTSSQLSTNNDAPEASTQLQSQSAPEASPAEGTKKGVVIVDEMAGDPNNFLIFNDNDIDTLQEEYRMLCTRTFLPPETKRTVKELPPGVLHAEQVQVLVENGWAQVRRVRIDGWLGQVPSEGGGEGVELQVARVGKRKRRLDAEELIPAPLEYDLLDASEVLYPTSATYRKKLITFRDLWRKGYYLTPGVNFGCDYLAYERLPGQKHSKYMVMCVDASTEVLRPLDLVATTRLGTQVNKRLLLAFVTPYSLVPQYSVMGWWKGDE